jgi:two-component system NarL family sensor kinase
LFEIPGPGPDPMFVCMDVDVTGRKQAEQDLRELAGRLMEVQDEERRRIGRDLHDSTGQALAALEINLAMAHRNLETPVPLAEGAGAGSWRQLLEDCIALAAQCSNEIRTTSYLLHPPLLDEVGLASALKWLVDGFSRRSQIAVSLLLPERLERLAPEQELALFRLVQEALTNVHRHSGSGTAEIVLQCRDETVVVEVRDAGAGIPVDELANFRQGGTALGVGLAGMRQRFRQLGGTLEIESNRGSTIVTASIPARWGESASRPVLQP